MRFSEILFIATVVTGGIWVLDILFIRHKRTLYILEDTKNKNSIKEPWWIEYSKSFFPILLIVFILRSFLVEPFRIPSGSMRPTLLEGDFIVVNKFKYGLRLPLLGTKVVAIDNPKRGDVVVFKRNRNGKSIDMIKRVVGLPNDHVQYKDKILYINGDPIKQEFRSEKIDNNSPGAYFPVKLLTEYIDDKKHDILVQLTTEGMHYYKYDDVIVPPNHYFVIGDNRDQSDDSRFWGFVADEDVQGQAIAIWMSWDSTAYRIRWDRLKFIY